MAEFIPVDPFDIVIFGGTGDLSRRKLLPALYHRYLDGQIDNTSKIIGIARTDLDRQAFIDLAQKACKADTKNFDKNSWNKFAERLDYLTMDATKEDADWATLQSMLANDDRPVVFYLATTPLIYVDLCHAMARAGLNTDNSRLVLEKPIGTNLESAREINEGVGAVFEENQIYRIDHYLGKETVQNLLVLRFANTLFEPIWSRHNIDHVQITVSESLSLIHI